MRLGRREADRARRDAARGTGAGNWAEVGRFTLPNGEPVRLYAFVMVLSFSRTLYVEFTRSMRVETLIRCHQNALTFFGGWSRQILYDNMRQVVVGPERINSRFRD